MSRVLKRMVLPLISERISLPCCSILYEQFPVLGEIATKYVLPTIGDIPSTPLTTLAPSAQVLTWILHGMKTCPALLVASIPLRAEGAVHAGKTTSALGMLHFKHFGDKVSLAPS